MNAKELLTILTDLNTQGYDLNSLEIKTAIKMNNVGDYFDGVFTTSYSDYSKKLDVSDYHHERQQLIFLTKL